MFNRKKKKDEDSKEVSKNNRTSDNQLVENVDYYMENGYCVFTAAFHKKRGYCCGSGCRHCPFEVHI